MAVPRKPYIRTPPLTYRRRKDYPRNTLSLWFRTNAFGWPWSGEEVLMQLFRVLKHHLKEVRVYDGLRNDERVSNGSGSITQIGILFPYAIPYAEPRRFDWNC